jgi:periplasmic protein TonB
MPKTIVLVALGVALLAPGVGGAQPSPEAASSLGPAPLTRPMWDRRPSRTDVERVYPRRTHPDRAEGRAVIWCAVNAGGALVDCTVESESGEGFGEAALRLSKLFRMRTTDGEGVSVVGRRIRVPFRLFAAPPSKRGVG